MKPLQVTIDLRLAGYRHGGIARYGEELADALEQVDGINIVPLRASRDQSAGKGVQRLRTPPHHRFERHAVDVELKLRRIRPDVHHAIDFIAPKLRGVPVVATVHDFEFLRHPHYLEDDALRYYQQINVSKQWTSAWITPSQWTADELCDAFAVDPRSVHVIPHGGPRELALSQPVPRSERLPFVLAVSTIEPRKRFDLLLDAVEALDSPPELRIVGRRGWKADDLVARIERTANVIWLNTASDEQLWDLYRKAFAVVVPSQSEGFGFAALEAMAAGTPVISSGNGALTEVTGEAALVPVSDDPAGWADAIQRILNEEPLWNELSLFGQRRAREFTWQRAAAATTAVYRKVAGR